MIFLVEESQNAHSNIIFPLKITQKLPFSHFIKVKAVNTLIN